MMSETVLRQFVVGICVNGLANNFALTEGNLNHQFVCKQQQNIFLLISHEIFSLFPSSRNKFVIYRYFAQDIRLLDFASATFSFRNDIKKSIREQIEGIYAMTLFRYYLLIGIFRK